MPKQSPNWADPSLFFRELYPAIYRYVSVASGALPNDVEDLVQETLLQVWRDRRSFRPEGSPLAWAMAIARNRIRDRQRVRGRARKADEVLAALSSMESQLLPDHILQSEEMRS